MRLFRAFFIGLLLVALAGLSDLAAARITKQFLIDRANAAAVP